MTANASAAATATYQKNHSGRSLLDSQVITSGAVPPNVATVRLYQAPMPVARSSVGNSSLMIAGAMEAISAYRPSPVQKTTISENRLSRTRNDSGTMSTAIAPDHTSSCGLRPNRSDSAPKGKHSATNSAVPIDRAMKTSVLSAPRKVIANGVSALKNV